MNGNIIQKTLKLLFVAQPKLCLPNRQAYVFRLHCEARQSRRSSAFPGRAPERETLLVASTEKCPKRSSFEGVNIHGGLEVSWHLQLHLQFHWRLQLPRCLQLHG